MCSIVVRPNPSPLVVLRPTSDALHITLTCSSVKCMGVTLMKKLLSITFFVSKPIRVHSFFARLNICTPISDSTEQPQNNLMEGSTFCLFRNSKKAQIVIPQHFLSEFLFILVTI